MPSPITVDYVIIGSGAGGINFADTVVSDSNYTAVVIDQYDAPGGHWNISYPFVRLHAPSITYGVNSRAMPSDSGQWQAMLASRHEILDYFTKVMRDTLLPSGRVQYFPRHVADESAGSMTVRARSLLTGEVTEFVARRRVVDSTYAQIRVPAMGLRNYEVGPSAKVIPVGELVEAETPERYTVIGAGKTAMDACLYLLDRGVPSDRIQWIMSRAVWMLNRASVEQGDPTMIPKMDGIQSVTEFLDFAEGVGMIGRLYPDEYPEGFRCATVSPEEMIQLRSITDVVRLGRVRAIDSTWAELDRGRIPSSPDTLYIDCSSEGIGPRPLRPIYTAGRVTVQTVITCLLPIAGAIAAKLDFEDDLDDQARNELAQPVIVPYTSADTLDFWANRADLLARWSVNPLLSEWLPSTRLGVVLPGLAEASNPEFNAVSARVAANLRQLQHEAALEVA
ncbi:NAD(P)/FAD-dependent oxidoreductase [Kribbella speibonae]|uniref:NAD(P)/FAD-dependent oxidoreductase n=1 Tax=Kribbella speibonae TaxID=1572660 RepID=A0A4R0IT92_9ACTN|nr:NAD(P)/FAD-dependent oxidoreductase [Kribbella speibonae]TCC36419.1 NAD(P)/FAD-dependent oxidoreductase [Kribbella speibonae]